MVAIAALPSQEAIPLGNERRSMRFPIRPRPDPAKEHRRSEELTSPDIGV
jgi:hypothetical protein